jgi:D-sedoheptulose 7-phosphate isomerase
MMNWAGHFENLKLNLLSLSTRNHSGEDMEPDSAFAQWREHTLQIRSARKSVFLIGNGASASMASHIAADLAKNAHIRTEVFSDLSLITAIANDLSYVEVFAEPLRRRMTEGDMLVAISSSGKSSNILRGVQEAKRLGGIGVTLSAMDSSNALRTQGLLNFYVPAMSYGMAETCHAAILHYWMDLIVASIT